MQRDGSATLDELGLRLYAVHRSVAVVGGLAVGQLDPQAPVLGSAAPLLLKPDPLASGPDILTLGAGHRLGGIIDPTESGAVSPPLPVPDRFSRGPALPSSCSDSLSRDSAAPSPMTGTGTWILR